MKFNKQSITNLLDDAPTKFVEFRVNQFSAMCLQLSKRPSLILIRKFTEALA